MAHAHLTDALIGESGRFRTVGVAVVRGDIEYFSKLVDNKSIGENDYNIAVSSCVAQKDTREVIDITTLNVEIAGIVARQNELRTAIDEIVVDLEGSR